MTSTDSLAGLHYDGAPRPITEDEAKTMVAPATLAGVRAPGHSEDSRMTSRTLAAPASRIARRTPAGEWQADGRRIPLVVLEPDVFETFGACVTRGWSEIPGCGAGSADVTGPIGIAIASAVRTHRLVHGVDSVWIADTRGRTIARSVYPWNGAGVRVSG